jgi:transcription elongation factor GreA
MVRWFGDHRRVDSLTPAEVSKHCLSYPPSDTELERKLETLRRFLRYLKKQGWTRANLAVAVKGRKAGRAPSKAGKAPAEAIQLTGEGHAALQQELAGLKQRRPAVVEAIRIAAADKDFRENSPLAAAKEELGHIDGRIHHLEETLKLAFVKQPEQTASKVVRLGSLVVLREQATGQVLKCMLVSTREASPANGKISDSSPLGKAIMGRKKGEVVEIMAPAGRIGYLIESVEHR